MSSYKDLLDQSVIGSHLEKYPLFNEATAFLLSFSLVAYPLNLASKLTIDAKSLVKNYLPIVISSTDNIEKWIVSVLFINTLDKVVPSLQTIKYQDLTLSNGKEYISNLEATKKLLNSDIVHSVENFFNYTLKLVNEKLLSPSVSYVAKATPESTEASEYNKTKELSKVLYDSLRSKPYEIQNHITKVYQDEKSKTEEGLKTLKGKSGVYVEEISNKLNSGLTKVKETVGVSKTNATATTDKLAEQVNDVANGIANGVSNGVEQVSNGASSAIEAN